MHRNNSGYWQQYGVGAIAAISHARQESRNMQRQEPCQNKIYESAGVRYYRSSHCRSWLAGCGGILKDSLAPSQLFVFSLVSQSVNHPFSGAKIMTLRHIRHRWVGRTAWETSVIGTKSTQTNPIQWFVLGRSSLRAEFGRKNQPKGRGMEWMEAKGRVQAIVNSSKQNCLCLIHSSWWHVAVVQHFGLPLIVFR